MELLKELRTKHELTRTELAMRLGVAVSTIKNWEHGDSLPSIKKIERIAAHFEIPTERLIEDVDRDRARREAEREKPEAAAEAVEPTPRTEETRESRIIEDTPKQVLPQVRTATDAEYREAVSAAVKALRVILGSDSNGQRQIMLAVGFVTAEIENRLFIKR